MFSKQTSFSHLNPGHVQLLAKNYSGEIILSALYSGISFSKNDPGFLHYVKKKLNDFLLIKYKGPLNKNVHYTSVMFFVD